jgi:radical SAM superfamily enzyme YgiQ (UPF0313 family)
VLPDADIWRGAGVVRLNDGCPMRCAYCASHLISPHFRPGDVTTTLHNIEIYKNRCNVRSIAFYDDALLHRKDRALVPLLEEIVDRDLDLSFYLPNAVHLRYLDPKTAGLMKRAGFREVRLGFESSSAAFHSLHDAKVEAGDLAECVRILKDAGFGGGEIITYVLAGMPDQAPEEVEGSIRHAASLGVRISVAEYSPVPGTSLWDRTVSASPFPIADEPLFQNNSLFPLRRAEFTTGDLQRLKDLARGLSPLRV